MGLPGRSLLKSVQLRLELIGRRLPCDSKDLTPIFDFLQYHFCTVYSHLHNHSDKMDNPAGTTRLSFRAAPPQLKTPKGTLDFIGTEMKLRKHIL